MSGVGVLAVMERAGRRYAVGSRAGQEMRDARAAVKELIESANDFRDCEHVASWGHLSPARRMELIERYRPETGTRPVRESRERFFAALAHCGETA